MNGHVPHLRPMFQGARILVAPLDWGLGHAARCIPVVQALIHQGAVPVIGADNGPAALLRDAFPDLEHVRIPGMEVRYASGRSQAWSLARQFPALLRQVRQERRWLSANQDRLVLDAIISDQRFGIRSGKLPSVLITHQVFPRTPLAQALAQRINRRLIAPFHRCWVPDHGTSPGLAGDLSHGSPLPKNARYIGPLSRFGASMPAMEIPPYRVVAVVSGPEPQRSLLEKMVLEQLPGIDGMHLLVTGKPGTAGFQQGSVRVEGHLPTAELQAALVHAELIVGRTGYSTLMDLDTLGRAALLVPTPGQPEQEYLGRMQARIGYHTIADQRKLDIAALLHNPPPKCATRQADNAWSTALSDLARLISTGKPPN
jgi:UDP:flavonoid glycosyltransferase YjiC (YdhE family)